MKFRKARLKDFDELLKLIKKLVNRWSLDYLDYWRDNKNKLLKNTYVLELQAKIVGYVVFKVQKNSIYVVDVYVLKKYRGKGFAFKLLKVADKLKKDFNKKYVDVDVNVKNYPARKLYRKMGFEVSKMKSEKVVALRK
jgi:ribosomal protein S18 acetylase RimI-like enzyme